MMQRRRRNGSMSAGDYRSVIAAIKPLAWFDAAYDLYTDTLFTTPVINDGDVIAGWKDQSGNGYHVTQSVSGNRPVYRPVVVALNNKPSVQFASTSSQYLMRSVAAAIVGNLNTYSIYVVYATPTSQAQYMYSEGNTGTVNQILGNRTNFGAYEAIHRDDTLVNANPSAGTTAANGTKCLQTFRRGASNSFGLRVNGTQIATSTSQPTITTVNQMGIGASLRNTITQYFNGYISQIILTNADNFAVVEPVLAAYYGITLP